MTPLRNLFDLAPNAVHVWNLDLACPEIVARKWEQVLSPDELARAERFRVEKARFQFIGTRGFLRVLLACYLGTDPGRVILRKLPDDKPVLRDPCDSRLEFNISHSADVSLLAFSTGRQVGVDLERLRTNFEMLPLARRFFSACEQEQLQAADAADRFEAYFRCWTRKEAFIKADGSGLSRPLDQFDVSIAPSDADALLATRPDRTEVDKWLLRDIPVGAGYVAALCAAGRNWHHEIRSAAEVAAVCETISL